MRERERGRIVISEKFHVCSIGRERKPKSVGRLYPREVPPPFRLARAHHTLTNQPQRSATAAGAWARYFSFIRLDGAGLVGRLNSILGVALRHAEYRAARQDVAQEMEEM